ncbi:hypothetical protein A7D00_4534 [Trichophyton violaceum]|uniref:Uncharacterized protein n=1 Tax=Trichophyton violaceum TaxID=34388 RepID=A0A178FH28_TRIVO|nr:hypothetical protein A7D00_4534 [Trichophyton violaceum]
MTLTHIHPEEDAPPPYTPTDPLTPASTINDAASQLSAENIPSYTHAVEAPNFVSAVPYFSERGLSLTARSDAEVLEHTLVFYRRSQAKDFSKYPRCWRSRTEEITQHDWDTFLNYLLPPHLGPASNHPQLPQKLRAEIERDRKDRPQETEEERQWRITAVVTEWNVNFFQPRRVVIVYCFVREDGGQPESPLCPSCYPNTTSSRSRNDIRRPLFENPMDTTSREIPELPQPPNTVRRGQQNRQTTNAADPPAAAAAAAAGSGSSDNQYQYRSSPAGGPGVWVFNPGAAVNNIASMISDQVQRYSQYVSEQAMEHSRRRPSPNHHGVVIMNLTAGLVAMATFTTIMVDGQVEVMEDPDKVEILGVLKDVSQVALTGDFGGIKPIRSSESLDSASSDSDLKKGELAALKTALQNLKQQQEQRQLSTADYRARRKELRRDCKALKSARREFRSAGRRCRGAKSGGSGGSSSRAAGHPSTARGEFGSDIDEIKRDMQEIKDHYVNLIRSLQGEKRELKQAAKNLKQEEKQARKQEKQARKQEKAARKEERKRAKEKGKGKAKETEPDIPLERRMEDMNISSNIPPREYPQTPQAAGMVMKDVKQ